jgi:hypothetical protein
MKNGPRIHEKLFWTQKAKKRPSLKIEQKIFFGFKYLPSFLFLQLKLTVRDCLAEIEIL